MTISPDQTGEQAPDEVPVLSEELAMEAYRAIVAHLATSFGYDDLTPDDHATRQGIGDPAWNNGPVLCRDFEGWHTDTSWAVVWDGGPFEWSYLLPMGGRGEFGIEVEPVRLPDGVACDSFSNVAISLYPADR